MNPNTALLVIDVQCGLDHPKYGRRSNPDAEKNIARLLAAWREAGRPVIHVQHLSTSPDSPLRAELPGVAIKPEAAPLPGEPLFQKRVNAAFVGTGLENYLRSHAIDSVVVVGLTADHCVSSTARLASDLGFRTTVVADATAAFEMEGYDGRRFSAEDVHAIALVNLKDEFAAVVSTDDLLNEVTGGELYRLSAFTTTPEGGNPAGVWIGEALPEPERMLAIAKEVGFSETAFVAPAHGTRRTVHYYSPEAEVPFCGHATIAAGVRLGRLSGEGRYVFDTVAGEVSVDVRTKNGLAEASLTSVEPRHYAASNDLLDSALEALHWERAELDDTIPAAMAYAGAWHLVIAAATLERLNRLDYDFEKLKAIMLAAGITTVQLIWRENRDLFHARDPFPVGGVVEDPATGAAAAALGGYLRDTRLIDVPASIRIRQGEAFGRPSLLSVHIPEQGGIVVSGHAVDL